MSAECERVFSCAKKTITDEWNRLKPAQIEANECQKDWLKKKLVKSHLHPPDRKCLREWGYVSEDSELEDDKKKGIGGSKKIAAVQLD